MNPAPRPFHELLAEIFEIVYSGVTLVGRSAASSVFRLRPPLTGSN
jgi:hypothetical protein